MTHFFIFELLFYFFDISQIEPLEILSLFRIGIIMPALIPGGLASVLANVTHQHRHSPQVLSRALDLLLMAPLLAVRTDSDLLGLSLQSPLFHLRAVEERHGFQAARAAEALRVDGVGGGGLPAAAITFCLVEPVDLRLDPSLQLLEGRLQFSDVNGRTVVLGDEGGSR